MTPQRDSDVPEVLSVQVVPSEEVRSEGKRGFI